MDNFEKDEKKMKKDDAIFNVLREYVKDSKRIRFEGDGYGKAWEVEAKKRGLSNHRSTPEALKAKVAEKTIALYEELNIMSRVEIEARYEIKVEEYSMRIQIEGRVLGDIARNHVIPTAIKYQNILTGHSLDHGYKNHLTGFCYFYVVLHNSALPQYLN